MNKEMWKEHSDLKAVQAKLGPFYHIEERIGGGKYSNVYLVKFYNKKQALKIMDTEMMGMEFKNLVLSEKNTKMAALTQRFLQEARFYEKIKHPNIVKIISIGEANDEERQLKIPYFLMNYVDGPHLDDILKQDQKLSWQNALDISRQILDALSTIHEQKIIHRDIKPSNIMIEKESGIPIIIDFGLAKDFIEETGLTKSGELPGTPHYMSPEQCKSSKYLTPATDIYSFGVVLYKMLTGDIPFAGNHSFEIMYGHWSKPVPPVDEKTLRLPSGINEIICKALAKDPADRYKNAIEFKMALEEIDRNPGLTLKEIDISARTNSDQSILNIHNTMINYLEKNMANEAVCFRLDKKNLNITNPFTDYPPTFLTSKMAEVLTDTLFHGRFIFLLLGEESIPERIKKIYEGYDWTLDGFLFLSSTGRERIFIQDLPDSAFFLYSKESTFSKLNDQYNLVRHLYLAEPELTIQIKKNEILVDDTLIQNPQLKKDINRIFVKSTKLLRKFFFKITQTRLDECRFFFDKMCVLVKKSINKYSIEFYPALKER